MSRQVMFAAMAAASLISAQPSLVWAGSYSPLADRAATLGGAPFTLESADGVPYHLSNSHLEGDVGNPLADRAATLGGRPFAVQRDEAGAHTAFTHVSSRNDEEAVGNPLADRAATLSGKPFTVETDQAESSFVAVVH